MTELQIPLFFYYALFVKALQNVYLGNSFNIKHFIYQPSHLWLSCFLLMALKYSGFDSRGFLNVMKETEFYDILKIFIHNLHFK